MCKLWNRRSTFSCSSKISTGYLVTKFSVIDSSFSARNLSSILRIPVFVSKKSVLQKEVSPKVGYLRWKKRIIDLKNDLTITFQIEPDKKDGGKNDVRIINEDTLC